jgi:protein involved in polysaccharide export with SLBB domain
MRMRTSLLLLTFALFGSGCAANAAGPEPVRAQEYASGDTAGADATIQPGDRVALRIWNEPLMSDTFPVSETGEVVLPNLGSVRVADRTASELQNSLREAYSEYLRNPSVAVTALRRVAVQGEVREPDLYLVDLTMTLRDVIALAGGVTEQGNPADIRIIRGGEVVPVGRGRHARFSTIELRSGDQIMVGRRSWFELNSLAIATTAAIVASTVIPLLRSVF